LTLDPGTVAALKAWRKAQMAEQLAWGAVYADSGLVFTREDGTPLVTSSIGRTFARYQRDADLPRIRFHDLRHTHATLALQAGVHPKVVSARLGHASIAITLDTYSHTVPALEEEAATMVAGW
jgi:integrase